MNSPLPTLPDRIRQAIAPAHVAVEQTPFARGMVSGTIGRAEYVAGLAQLGCLHRELESATASASASLPAKLIPPPRTPAIERDLFALGGEADAEPHAVVAELTERFYHWAQATPTALLGAVYVMEGSRMGSMVLARSLTRALKVEPRPGQGLDYHIDGIATRPTDWKAFRAQLAGTEFSEDDQELIVAAAVQVMDALTALYSAVPVADFEAIAMKLETVAV